MTPKWNEPNRWRHVRDDDGHDYIIPADDYEQFREWVDSFDAFQEDKPEPYNGRDFSEYRCRMHPSCYVFVGTVEEDK